MYPESFEFAVNYAMQHEVGKHWKITDEVLDGLINTREQKRAVGYVFDPLDSGGETKFGIAQRPNPDVNVRELTWFQAKDIYYRKYWIKGQCDNFHSRVGIIHFDGCVNHGVTRANKILQQAAGLAPEQIDGIFGPITIDAVNSVDPLEMCNRIADIRVDFYHGIVERKPDQIRFLKGWLRRINDVRNFTTDPYLEV